MNPIIPRSVLIFTILLHFSLQQQGQNFQVGHRSITFTDPARNNRQVPAELFYPSATAGEATPVASGVFPVIVFGHGFQMGYDSYLYLKSALVPLGYHFILPTTEGTLAPSHTEFGSDLAFLVDKMKLEGVTPASPFYQHIDSTSAVMGHSMGGGSSFLACKNNPAPTVMVTLAAAETNPSAIAAARQIGQPSLVFSADKDCVTPPSQHQVPMYDSLASNCKVFINIKGGGHCYFADANFICNLGEFGCPAFTITREQQHDVTLDFLIPYLEYYLKNNAGSWTIFNDSLVTSQRITYMKSCTTTSIDIEPRKNPVYLCPNPAAGALTLTGFTPGTHISRFRVVNTFGQTMHTEPVKSLTSGTLLLSGFDHWPPGIYFICVDTEMEHFTFRFIKS